jgi:hypothetical protein
MCSNWMQKKKKKKKKDKMFLFFRVYKKINHPRTRNAYCRKIGQKTDEKKRERRKNRTHTKRRRISDTR